jgi:hypothetical protein
MVMTKGSLLFLFLGYAASASHAFIQPVASPLRSDLLRQKQLNPVIPIINSGFESTTSSLTKRSLSLSPIIASVSSLSRSLFSYKGQIPLSQAFGINFFLFAVGRSKLLKMLTPDGFSHAFALGTTIWTTLGWRGWTTCVAYLFLGSAVTKVKFAEKENRGIAESRGGRRGPENVW